jgi:PPOX class probable F420-dependent enzyme
MMKIPDSVKQLIASAPLAHLTTLNADGSPQVTVVWVGIQDDEFVCAHMTAYQKVRNIQNDPRVVLSMLGHKKTEMGLQEYLVVYGNAYLTEGGAADLLQKLAYSYIAPDVEFPPASVRNQPGFITHIVPQRFAGVGAWK